MTCGSDRMTANCALSSWVNLRMLNLGVVVICVTIWVTSFHWEIIVSVVVRLHSCSRITTYSTLAQRQNYLLRFELLGRAQHQCGRYR
jgi:hypothetical protein